jgi:hypothetical protein
MLIFHYLSRKTKENTIFKAHYNQNQDTPYTQSICTIDTKYIRANFSGSENYCKVNEEKIVAQKEKLG